jgi:hypothetical protein
MKQKTLLKNPRTQNKMIKLSSSLLGILAIVGAQPLLAAITYVDATTSNTFNAADAGTPWQTTTNSASDGLWALRTTGPGGVLANTTGYEAGTAEDAPMLRTTVTVAPGIYDVFVYYASKTNDNWSIFAGFSSASLALHGNTGLQVNAAGSTVSPVATNTDARYRSLIGQTTVGVDGILNVFNDDTVTGTTGVGDRSVYDGIGYELVPEPSTFVLTAVSSLLLFRRRRL